MCQSSFLLKKTFLCNPALLRPDFCKCSLKRGSTAGSCLPRNFKKVPPLPRPRPRAGRFFSGGGRKNSFLLFAVLFCSCLFYSILLYARTSIGHPSDIQWTHITQGDGFPVCTTEKRYVGRRTFDLQQLPDELLCLFVQSVKIHGIDVVLLQLIV